MNLKKLMEQENVSVNELSKKTSISRSSLTPLINNESKMVKFDTLDRLINFFKIDYDELFIEVPEGEIILSRLKQIDEKKFNTTLLISEQVSRESKALSVKTKILFNLLLDPNTETVTLKGVVEDKPKDEELFYFFDGINQNIIVDMVNKIISQLFDFGVIRTTGPEPHNSYVSSSLFSLDLLKEISKNYKYLTFIIDGLPMFYKTVDLILNIGMDIGTESTGYSVHLENELLPAPNPDISVTDLPFRVLIDLRKASQK